MFVKQATLPGFVSNKDSMCGFGQLYPIAATLMPPFDLRCLASYLSEKNSQDRLACLALDLSRERLAAPVSASSEPAVVMVRASAPTLELNRRCILKLHRP